MPEYTFQCEKCSIGFAKVWKISEYDTKIKNCRCPSCRSTRIVRNYYEDRVIPNYVKGLHECETLGEYADKQTKLYGKEKCEQMAKDFKTKRKPIENLPDGVTPINDVKDMD